ncbi:hypothetical protein A7D25_22540 [Pseudomonas sp. 21C1]|nr:hypothetical protein A7D25_22540 [Pseudomonas sp. 21C1]
MAECLADPVFQAVEWNGRTTDWFLQDQVKLVNKFKFSMDITIFTAGGTITGQLISAEEYFRLYAESFSEAFPEEQRQEIREAYEAKGRVLSQETDDEGAPSPQFLHLKSARLCSPSGQIPSAPGVLWRGTIASTSGFSLGELLVS